MILSEISITNFKNIAEARMDFSPNINAFLGRNGMGKTNLLDAIYYMSFGKSHTRAKDAEVMRSGEQFSTIRAMYLRRGQIEELTLGLSTMSSKSFKRQGKRYGRLSEHIGAFPVVMVSPRDTDLILGSPEDRRRFMDIIISQTNSLYLDRLIRYTELCKQRNKLIKDGISDKDLYASIELQMDAAAEYITSCRADFVERFREIFQELYGDISRTEEKPDISYQSKMRNNMMSLSQLLEQARTRDFAIGYTTVGPHRDDLALTINGMPAVSTASQGQQKTFAISMRLAQYEFMQKAVDMKPLLLLDDIFDKLDSNRVSHIIDIVSRDMFGQIFITDTNREHLDSIMAPRGVDFRLWEVKDGEFNEITLS